MKGLWKAAAWKTEWRPSTGRGPRDYSSQRLSRVTRDVCSVCPADEDGHVPYWGSWACVPVLFWELLAGVAPGRQRMSAQVLESLSCTLAIWTEFQAPVLAGPSPPVVGTRQVKKQVGDFFQSNEI